MKTHSWLKDIAEIASDNKKELAIIALAGLVILVCSVVAYIIL